MHATTTALEAKIVILFKNEYLNQGIQNIFYDVTVIRKLKLQLKYVKRSIFNRKVSPLTNKRYSEQCIFLLKRMSCTTKPNNFLTFLCSEIDALFIYSSNVKIEV